MSKEKPIWELKSEEVKKALRNGERLDGRKFDEYREIIVEKDLYKNAEGSANVSIGKTKVDAGVKLLAGEPYPDSPDQGTISVGVELSPLSSPEFKYGPPSEEAIEVSRVVDRGIREAKTIDFKKLCLKEGETVLIAFIDIYSTDHFGNLFDTSTLGAMASLLHSKIPKVEDGKVVKGEYSGKLPIDSTPLLCTFSKIDDFIVVDPSIEEEKATDARLSISVNEKGVLSAFQKGESGSFTLSEVDEMIKIALKRTKDLRKKVE